MQTVTGSAKGRHYPKEGLTMKMNRVFKNWGVVLLAAALLAGIVGGCKKKDQVDAGKNADATVPAAGGTLKVGAAVVPHADILKFVAPKLKEQGVNLEVVVLDDESRLNPALAEKQIDAN
jgi:D-methionine transport system substrate-binding protein